MKRFSVHPVNPQRRLMLQAADVLRSSGLVAMPTDACYVLACRLGDKAAVDRLRHIRGIDDKHLLTLMCRDLSELAQYAQVDNRQYRFLKEWTPGAYTFILPATKEVPRRLMHPSRKTGTSTMERIPTQRHAVLSTRSSFSVSVDHIGLPLRQHKPDMLFLVSIRTPSDLVAVPVAAR